MDYVYGQYLYCTPKFGKFFAKFLVYRPEKNTVVIDYDNRLHELNLEEVKKVELNDAIIYFDEKITQYIEIINNYEKSILEDQKDIKDTNIKIKNTKIEIIDLQEKITSYEVAKKLATSSDIKEVTDIEEKIDLLTKEKCEKERLVRACEEHVHNKNEYLNRYEYLLLNSKKELKRLSETKEQIIGGKKIC